MTSDLGMNYLLTLIAYKIMGAVAGDLSHLKPGHHSLIFVPRAPFYSNQKYSWLLKSTTNLSPKDVKYRID